MRIRLQRSESDWNRVRILFGEAQLCAGLITTKVEAL